MGALGGLGAIERGFLGSSCAPSRARRARSGSAPACASRRCHPPEVVGYAVHVELDFDLVGPSEDGLPHPPGSLDPAEGALHDVTSLHARLVARPLRRPPVEPRSALLLAGMSPNPQCPATANERALVVEPVCDRRRSGIGMLLKHRKSRFDFGRAGGAR